MEDLAHIAACGGIGSKYVICDQSQDKMIIYLELYTSTLELLASHAVLKKIIALKNTNNYETVIQQQKKIVGHRIQSISLHI